jgi:NAD(P)-dependent dehydrogenase (short-subunit alcohol dehydrogenase family)
MLIDHAQISLTALQNKVAVVTGAGQGIGGETARILAHLGASVVIAEINQATGGSTEETIRAEGGRALFVHTDIADFASMDQMRAQAIAAFGHVDILINNAEAVVFKAMIDHTIEEWDRVFAVNLRSALIGVKLFLPDMQQRKSGVIITMQSSEGMPYLSAYLASKVGLRSLALSLAAEVGEESGVSVYCFGPGMVDTPAVQRAAQELAPLYKVTPEEFIRNSAPGEKLTTPEVCATGLVGTILFAKDFHAQGDVHFLYGLAKLGLDAGGNPIRNVGMVAETPRAVASSKSSLDVVALNRKMEEIVGANQKEYESLSMFQKPVVKRMFQQGTGLKVEEWIARAGQMTGALENQTVTAQMRADYIALIQRMIAFITKQESDARGWIKDAKQLEIALAALAERKDTAQKLADKLTGGEINAT